VTCNCNCCVIRLQWMKEIDIINPFGHSGGSKSFPVAGVAIIAGWETWDEIDF